MLNRMLLVLALVGTAVPMQASAQSAGQGADWRDLPLSPGTWAYRQDARGSIALFGVPNADAAFTIRCDRAARSVYVSRAGSVAGATEMTIRTSSIAAVYPAQATGGQPPYVATAINPQSPALDAMAFSRGRFVVITPSLPTLVIPAWAEVSRVVEDCRA